MSLRYKKTNLNRHTDTVTKFCCSITTDDVPRKRFFTIETVINKVNRIVQDQMRNYEVNRKPAEVEVTEGVNPKGGDLITEIQEVLIHNIVS
jgi:hypothetical protein